MNKVIAILSEDPELEHLKKKFLAHIETFNTSKKFISKQIKDLEDRKNKAEKDYHEAFMKRLKEMGKLPADCGKDDLILPDLDRDCVLWHRHDRDCGHEMMTTILGMMHPPKDEE